MSPWSLLFVHSNDFITSTDSLLSRQLFVEKLTSLPYRPCLGPPISVPASELPSVDAINDFWDILQSFKEGRSNSDDQISSNEVKTKSSILIFYVL